MIIKSNKSSRKFFERIQKYSKKFRMNPERLLKDPQTTLEWPPNEPQTTPERFLNKPERTPNNPRTNPGCSEIFWDKGPAFGADGGSEVATRDRVYLWSDKYRPRKPRYFNRVKTGYDWNKYNQAHYDHDNPPPKTVQGYKFNVFYPDLIDKSKAPTYKIERDVSSINDDTCILKISSGPPYEDVAFRIVNKEWEYSHKKGFKCTFERGIFHLYVNFKRPRYRR